MNYRTTLRLLIVVCILGAGLWVMQRGADPAAERLAQSGRVLDGDLMNVEALTMLNGTYEMELVRRGDEWWMVHPVEGRADEARIGHILASSEALICHETITREQREHRGLSLGDYGLDVPHTAVRYRTPLGSRRLLIGNDARLGKRMYVRFDGESSVLLVDASLRAALPESIEAMRDLSLLHGQAARVTRLEIERPGGGFVQLLRGGAGWVMQQPVREPAAGGVIASLLESLYAARIERFIWDPPTTVQERVASVPPAVPVESYGLAADTAPARVRLWEAGDDVGRELVFGKVADAETGAVYASFTDEGAIVTLDGALLAQFELPVDNLRSRALVRMDPHDLRYVAVQHGDLKLALGRTGRGGWSILEPIQWPADSQTVTAVLRRLTEARIQSFVDASATNATTVADERLVLRVTLDSSYPPAAAATAPEGGGEIKSSGDTVAGRCELVAADSDDPDMLLVQCAQRPGRFLVRREALAALSAMTAMPLSFFDRSVLAVPPERVCRIRVQRGDVEQILECDAEGHWRALQPEGGLVDAAALSDVLFRVSNLRAERVEAQHPPGLTPYGLDAPQTSLTLGLTGGEAIQKIILVGATAGTSGRFAMVQGQDVIFVLDPATVESLLRGVVLVARNE
ncbi:MAG: DUF4340 domain-containing protein [Lentisphaerae bacterium]|nr:DUF4340 domain-containing protein [Lentisphaerota bacterium]